MLLEPLTYHAIQAYAQDARSSNSRREGRELSTMAIATRMKAGLEAWRTPEEGEAIPGAVLTEWVGIGLLLLLFATVLAGIWMVLGYGMVLPPEAICLRG